MEYNEEQNLTLTALAEIADSPKHEDENCDNTKLSINNFKNVNRNEEDLLIEKYQKTKNSIILDQLYEIRKQTLQIWAKKYAYLRMSEEDLLSEISTIWLKCVNRYEYKPKKRIVRTKSGKYVFNKKGGFKTIFKRTPFNTFLYTSLRNYMSNISKRQYSKKRVDRNGKKIESNLISIDYEYSVGNDSSRKLQLKDILRSKSLPAYSKISVESMIDDISKGDNDIKGVLTIFVGNPHIKKISYACQNLVEKIKLNRKDTKIFKGHRGSARKRLKEIIRQSNKHVKGYKLLHFRFDKKTKIVTFEVKIKDTVVLRKTLRALEKYKQKLELEMQNKQN